MGYSCWRKNYGHGEEGSGREDQYSVDRNEEYTALHSNSSKHSVGKTQIFLASSRFCDELHSGSKS